MFGLELGCVSPQAPIDLCPRSDSNFQASALSLKLRPFNPCSRKEKHSNINFWGGISLLHWPTEKT